MSLAENEKVWVAFCDPDYFGPLSAVEIKQYLIENKINDDDCLWKKGWKKWKQTKTIPLFAYECKQSVGTGKSIPEIPIPDEKEFEAVISPKLSGEDLNTTKDWDAKRITIVAGSAFLAGVPGAVAAGILTNKGNKKREEAQKNREYIDDKNK
jgi:hypothetical protein